LYKEFQDVMDDPWNDSMNELKTKVQKLVGLYEESRHNYDALHAENRELKETVQKTEQELNELKNKYNTLKIAKSLTASSDDKHDARIKVNKMVREIDKCIALLNR
jgi:predicted nuclease with TOPRIM domain